MSDATTRTVRRDAGFTLLEIMVAMGILVFGVTSLIGVLGVGVSTRRTADMRAQAVLIADQALHDVEERFLADAPLDPEWQEPEDLAIQPVTVEEIPGHPGLRYTVEFQPDVERPDLVLVTVRVAWLDQGEESGEVFRRILARQVPFSTRVERRLDTVRAGR